MYPKRIPNNPLYLCPFYSLFNTYATFESSLELRNSKTPYKTDFPLWRNFESPWL
jgi:hypothetical protein